MDRRRFLVSSLVSGIASATLCAAGGRRAFASGDAAAAGESAPDGLTPLPAALQQKLAHDPLRPQFHLLPRHNWMNDPCAPRFHDGKYHMFFQYNPQAAVWGDMHWNHASSPDMIHWRHEPLALAPGPEAFDAFGIFTGSVLPGMDVASVLYTGVRKSTPAEETIRGEGTREVQCLATSTDPMLRTWKKLDRPVIDGPPPGVKVTGFRDPCPWKEGDTWYLGVGSGFEKVGGAVLLYSSKDGRSWTYLHALAQGKWNGGMQKDPVDTGEMWECPDFFPLGEKHVLLYSTERKVYWNVGVFDKKDLRFHAEASGLLDHGSYYAMKSMVDEKGRRILWGWVPETRPAEACIAAGWSGSMALPRVLSIGEDNRLRMEVPAEFVTALEHNVQTLDRSGQPGAGVEAWLGKQAIRERAGRVVWSFRPGVKACGLELRGVRTAGADTAMPLVSVAYDGAAKTVKVGDKVLGLSPDAQGVSTVEMWVDGSVIEVFVDRQEAVTLRNYVVGDGEMKLAWMGDGEVLQSMRVAGVAAISPDRLTT